ncbi:DUF402 domain-containing protein [Acidaminobacter sp. JC074]|uniref:DUF402 domain-containing protein n=1 Tax=Acidaminobacter sp. JC074 TaxID=2530199 RepID=UPI001F0ECA8A|nr:DUF402 domain-containing protein [Acidaminobacter sp. JC074]MCH4887845.1 DUF402 domain-containing protein [Acidaminobacter sp. JC074]
MKKKFMDGSEIDKSWLLEHRSVLKRLDRACLSLVHVDKVSFDLPVDYDDSGKCLITDGYKCMMYLPVDEYWCLSVFMDEVGSIIEWYFDMTKENVVNKRPYFIDSYLDIAVSADGYVAVLDQDELEEAYINQVITKEERDRAYETCHMIQEKIIPDKVFMHDFFHEEFHKMIKK